MNRLAARIEKIERLHPMGDGSDYFFIHWMAPGESIEQGYAEARANVPAEIPVFCTDWRLRRPYWQDIGPQPQSRYVNAGGLSPIETRILMEAVPDETDISGDDSADEAPASYAPNDKRCATDWTDAELVALLICKGHQRRMREAAANVT